MSQDWTEDDERRRIAKVQKGVDVVEALFQVVYEDLSVEHKLDDLLNPLHRREN